MTDALTPTGDVKPPAALLSWSPWVGFDGGDFSVLPRGAGLYQVRAVGERCLAYIGQTGRDIQQRLAALRTNAFSALMPFNDPHTAAPALWAWRDCKGLRFECRAASFIAPQNVRLAVECWLLWQHRLEHGRSTWANFGHFPAGYRKSRNRSTGVRGGPVLGLEADKASEPASGPLLPQGVPTSPDWMGLRWSAWQPMSRRLASQLHGPGVYRIRHVDALHLRYVGESKSLQSRLESHARSLLSEAHEFSVALLPNGLVKSYRLEIENDLIASYFASMQRPPERQFRQVAAEN